MEKTIKTIRASEITAFLYCKRAWWYGEQSTPSENQEEMAAGSTFHNVHGKQVVVANVLRMAGWMLLLMAITLLAVSLTLEWLN